MLVIDNKYDPIIKLDDPNVTLKIPCAILRDLVTRSEENGHTIEMEFAIRLARSLERDLIKDKQDDDLAYKAFMVSQE